MKFSTIVSLFVVLPAFPFAFALEIPSGVLPRQNGNNGKNNGGNGGGGGGNGGNGAGDPQTSLTLDPKVIAPGFANNGQDVPAAGQVASLTSTNNFINFCLTVPLPLTDGKQVTGGSCNPTPIGAIPSVDGMPSAKFTVPKNGDTIPSDQAFTITMAIANMQTGAFVNAQANYFSAPQQLNGQGKIVGHSHVVVEQLSALDQTAPTDPKKFAFFKGLNGAAQGGVLTADVTNGLPAGAYRLCSINSAANHQPVVVPIAQHGALDDCVYFTATPGGAPPAGNGNNNGAGGNPGANGNNGGNNGAGGNNGGNNGAGNNGGNNGVGGNNGAGGNNGGNNGAGNSGGNNGAGGGNGGSGAPGIGAGNNGNGANNDFLEGKRGNRPGGRQGGRGGKKRISADS